MSGHLRNGWLEKLETNNVLSSKSHVLEYWKIHIVNLYLKLKNPKEKFDSDDQCSLEKLHMPMVTRGSLLNKLDDRISRPSKDWKDYLFQIGANWLINELLYYLIYRLWMALWKPFNKKMPGNLQDYSINKITGRRRKPGEAPVRPETC